MINESPALPRLEVEMTSQQEMAALEKALQFMEPYEKAYPDITFARAIEMECAAIEAVAVPQLPCPLLSVKQIGARTWTVIHEPTDRLIGRFRTRSDAEELLRRVSHLDWNFTDPYGTPPATMRELWPIFRGVEMGLFRKKRRSANQRVRQAAECPKK